MRNYFENVMGKVEDGMIRASLTVKNEIRKANAVLAGEEGDMVQTVIIVAVFAMIAVAVMAVLGGAIRDKGEQAAEVIQSASF